MKYSFIAFLILSFCIVGSSQDLVLLKYQSLLLNEKYVNVKTYLPTTGYDYISEGESHEAENIFNYYYNTLNTFWTKRNSYLKPTYKGSNKYDWSNEGRRATFYTQSGIVRLIKLELSKPEFTKYSKVFLMDSVYKYVKEEPIDDNDSGLKGYDRYYKYNDCIYQLTTCNIRGEQFAYYLFVIDLNLID